MSRTQEKKSALDHAVEILVCEAQLHAAIEAAKAARSKAK